MYNATKVLMRDGVGQFGCQFIEATRKLLYHKTADISRPLAPLIGTHDR
jgi:hypothetical protein